MAPLLSRLGVGGGNGGFGFGKKRGASGPAAIVTATGGSTTTYNGYKIHTFTTGPDTFTVSSISGPGTQIFEYLVVGGGGGGGYDRGGGGGAGGVRYSRNFPISGPFPSPYSITIGNGGPGGNGPTVPGSDGTSSSFGPIITNGGGGGGTNNNGRAGGSGGGGSGNSGSRTGGSGNHPVATTPPQGNDGGTANDSRTSICGRRRWWMGRSRNPSKPRYRWSRWKWNRFSNSSLDTSKCWK